MKAIKINDVLWTKDTVKAHISDEKNPTGVYRALLRVYAHQTKDEQRDQSTKHTNGMGFSGCDAEILSSFAEQYNRRKFLIPKQLVLARKRLVKYSGQIFNWMLSEHSDKVVDVKPEKKAAEPVKQEAASNGTEWFNFVG